MEKVANWAASNMDASGLFTSGNLSAAALFLSSYASSDLIRGLHLGTISTSPDAIFCPRQRIFVVCSLLNAPNFDSCCARCRKNFHDLPLLVSVQMMS